MHEYAAEDCQQEIAPPIPAWVKTEKRIVEREAQ
jgi:hypothetical protein